MDLRTLPPLEPAAFVELTFPSGHREKIKKSSHLFKEPYALPLYILRPHEKEGVRMGMAWSEKGLYFVVEVDKALEESFFPDFARGDGLLLFLDTRGVFGAKRLHKYCHHFLFLPGEEIKGREVTPFHLEDRHPLSPPENLKVEVEKKGRSYRMEIEIPEISLFGYDPHEYKKMKLGLALYRKEEDPLYFPLNGEEMRIENHPEVWAFVELV